MRQITIDGIDAGEDEYKLSEDGLLTFTPDVFGEIEISYKTEYRGVLQTHPERDVLLAKHPLEKFGCTPCHGGQGHGLTAKAAHALTHWRILAYTCAWNGKSQRRKRQSHGKNIQREKGLHGV